MCSLIFALHYNKELGSQKYIVEFTSWFFFMNSPYVVLDSGKISKLRLQEEFPQSLLLLTLKTEKVF